MAEARSDTVFDVTHQYLGSVYAQALLGATEKAGNTEETVAQLDSCVDDVLANLPHLRATLASPRVPLQVKEGMLDRGFADKVSSQLLNLLKVLVRRGRFETLAAIRRETRRQFNELRGRTEVTVRSAEPLDDAARETVTSRLGAALGRTIDLHLEVDPDLIGGVVIRVGDTVYDGSVVNRLKRLRDDMVVRAAEKIRENVDRFALAE